MSYLRSSEDTSIATYAPPPVGLRAAFARRIWQTAIIHILLAPWVAWYLLRHRVSPAVFAHINPAVPDAHQPGESKEKLFQRLRERRPDLAASVPKTLFLSTAMPMPERLSAVAHFLRSERLSYPLVAKPDRGTRSIGAFRVQDEEGLRWLMSSMTTEYLIQEYRPEPVEAGLYFVRATRAGAPARYGIAVKHHVYGDTRTPHPKLISLHTRFLCADLTPELTPALRDYIDGIADAIPFNMGRIDALAESVEELLFHPEHVKILEINTGGPDVAALHITDRRHSFRTQYILSKQALRGAMELGAKHCPARQQRVSGWQFAARYIRYWLFLWSVQRGS